MRNLLMKSILLASAGGVLFALSGCTSKPPEPKAKPAAAHAQVSTPWDGMKQDEQRARDVQKTVDAQARRQQAAIDAASQ